MSPTAKYLTGYIISIVLTLSAYAVVVNHMLTTTMIVIIIVVLAIAQFIVQLRFFLHLGQEDQPRWKLWSFIAMFLVLSIVVIGSLWIMQNLDYHMMQPMEADQHMIKEGNKGF